MAEEKMTNQIPPKMEPVLAEAKNGGSMLPALLVGVVIVAIVGGLAYFFVLGKPGTPALPEAPVPTVTGNPLEFLEEEATATPVPVVSPEATTSGTTLPTLGAGHSVEDIESDLKGVDLGSSDADLKDLKKDTTGL